MYVSVTTPTACSGVNVAEGTLAVEGAPDVEGAMAGVAALDDG
jgi:hypothetical protein